MTKQNSYYVGGHESESQIQQIQKQLLTTTDPYLIKMLINQLRSIQSKISFNVGTKHGFSKGLTLEYTSVN